MTIADPSQTRRAECTTQPRQLPSYAFHSGCIDRHRCIRDKVTIVDELLEIDAFDGKKKTILNYTAPVLDAQGEVQGAIVVNQDITERKHAAEALSHARDEWEDTFNSITDMITVHDNDFNIIHANKAARQILGLPLSGNQCGAK